MDPIEEFEGEGGDENHRNRLIYGYREGETIAEVLKQRAKREDLPDYWETARPLITLDMIAPADGRERYAPVAKEVLYIDFR